MEIANCDCAERVRNLSRLYDARYVAAAESGQREVQEFGRQVRDDLAALADNCERTPDV